MSWISSFKKRLPAPSAIIHFGVVEVVLQIIWWLVGNLIGVHELVRDVGVLGIFCLGILAVAWYLPKIWPTDKGVRDTQTVRAQLDSVAQESKSDERYTAMLRLDRENPSRLIKVTPGEIDWSHAHLDIGAYIDFNVSVYSATVYCLEFGEAPTGQYTRLFEEGERMREITKLPQIAYMADILKGLERGNEGTIRIRQYLTPEIHAYLQSIHDMKRRGDFDFGRTYSLSDQGSLSSGPTWEVHLPVWMSVPIPEDVLYRIG